MNTYGSLDIITGPMFSGKSTELLRRLFIDVEMGYKILYVNHSDDTRSDGPYSTHNPLYKEKLEHANGVEFVSSSLLSELNYDFISSFDVIGIDEGNFFEDLYDTVKLFVESYNMRVIVAGLSGSFERKKFGQILDLEPLSDSFTKLQSYCKHCMTEYRRKRLAPFTHRVNGGTQEKQVGGHGDYIPVCRECHQQLNRN